MDLTIVGCSGSYPGPESAASCYLVDADGFRLLLDLGNGALGSLQNHADLAGIDAVCLSHLHADHCLDMCGYHVFRTYHPAGSLPPIPVYAPAGAADRLDRALGSDAHPMAEVFDFVPLVPGTVQIGPVSVMVRRMNHPVETFGFRLEHGGKVIAYSADTGPTEQLVGLADAADVLLCEASFLDGPDLPADLHLTARQAGEYAARAGVGRLALTHLVPWYSRERSLAEAATSFSGDISLATPGMVI
ncbi:MAG TPA: MBL fold metallo-hydrolase [Streptosporangiaceae bacterium]|nr:MBL fold metallo-hydrolase [Streptosporangiaceae bacterium]